MEVYIQEKGCSIRQEKEHFLIKTKEQNNCLSPKKIEKIILEDSCSISSNAIKLALENDIPIFLTDEKGKIYGTIWKNGYSTNANIRLKQTEVFKSEFGRKLGIKWIVEKIESQKNHIIKICRRRDIECEENIKSFDNIIKSLEKINLKTENYENIVMGYEGVASNLYYKVISETLPEFIKFEKRENRGAKDIYNIVLNYAFGVLYSNINHDLILAGLDTKIGVLHRNAIGKDALLYDFIERYRIIAWETVYGLFSKKLFNKGYIEQGENIITILGRRVILRELNNKLISKIEYNGKKFSYKEIIKKETMNLAKEILEYDVHNYI